MEEAGEWCRFWQSHLEERVVDLLPVDELLSDAIATSLKLKHPLYDCFYLVACQRTHAKLATFDERLAKVALRNGLQCDWLRDRSQSESAGIGWHLDHA